MAGIKDVTRVEVIKGGERLLVELGVEVQVYAQDEGRTLKIFLKDREDKEATLNEMVKGIVETVVKPMAGKLCGECGMSSPSAKFRRFKAKGYMGPCADSFCVAGCTSSVCFESEAVLCDDCFNSMVKR